MTLDKRNFEREEKYFIVNIKPSVLTVNYYIGLTKNISMDGFSFESQNYDIKAGDCLEFELKDPQGSLSVSVNGRVIWKTITDFECFAGVQFIGLDDEVRRNIFEKVPENQQVDVGPPDNKEAPAGTVTVEEEKPAVTQEEGAISQAISRVADRLDLDEAVRGISNAGASQSSSDKGICSESSAQLEHKAAGLNESIPGREAYQGDAALIYKSDHDINWGISEKEREALQNSEREKARRTHWYIAAVVFIVLIAFAVFMRLITIEKDMDAPVQEELQMEDQRTIALEALPEMNQDQQEASGNEMQDNISPVEIAEIKNKAIEGFEQVAVSPENKDVLSTVKTSVPLITQDKGMPVRDISLEPPVDVKEEPPKPGTAKKTAMVVEQKTVHEKLQMSLGPSDEIATPSEVHVNESEKLRTDTVREVNKQSAMVESLPEKPERDAERIEAEQDSNTGNEKSETVNGHDKPLESATGLNDQELDTAAAVEAISATDTKLIIEGYSISESDKVSDERKLSIADEDKREKGLFVGSSWNGYAFYQEPFDDNANNWKLFDTYSASAQIKEGEYYLKNKRGSGPHLVFHDHVFPFKSDFLIEVSIRTVNTAGSFAYGVVFGAQGALDNYTFQVTNNKGFSIRKNERGVLNQLAEGNLNNIYSNLHNILRIARQGEKIRFFINGKYIAGISDLALSGNRLGFIIEGKSEISVDRIYTRVKVEQ